MVKGQMDMVEKFAVGLIVNNRFGVLNRIAGLYAKRCYNIDSLSVGETENPEFSRMTIVSTGDEYMKDQVVRQLEKLIDVRAVALLEPENAVFAQHMFIKMHLTGTERGLLQASGAGADQPLRRQGGGFRGRASDRRDHRGRE